MALAIISVLWIVSILACLGQVEGFHFFRFTAKSSRHAPTNVATTASVSSRFLHLYANEGHIQDEELGEISEVVIAEPVIAKKKRARGTASAATDEAITPKKKRAPKAPTLNGNDTEVEGIKKKRAPRAPKLKDSNSTEAVKKEKKGKGNKKAAPLTPRQASGYNFTNEEDEYPCIDEPKWYKLLAMPRSEIKVVQFIKQKIVKKIDHPLHGIIEDAHVMCMAKQPLPAGVIYIKASMNMTIGETILESIDKIGGFERNMHGFVTPLGPSLVKRVEDDIAGTIPANATGSLRPSSPSPSTSTSPSPSPSPRAAAGLTSSPAPMSSASLPKLPTMKTPADSWAASVSTSRRDGPSKAAPALGSGVQGALGSLKDIMSNMAKLKKLRRDGIPDDDLLQAAFTKSFGEDDEEDEYEDDRYRGSKYSGSRTSRDSRGTGQVLGANQRWGDYRRDSTDYGVPRGAAQAPPESRRIDIEPDERIFSQEVRRGGESNLNKPSSGNEPKAWAKVADRGQSVSAGRWGQGDSRLEEAARTTDRSQPQPATPKRTPWRREAIDGDEGFTLDQVVQPQGRAGSSSSRKRDDIEDLYDMLQEEEHSQSARVDTRAKVPQGQAAKKDVKAERVSKDRIVRGPSKSGVDDIAKDVTSFSSFDDFLAAISGESASKKR